MMPARASARASAASNASSCRTWFSDENAAVISGVENNPSLIRVSSDVEEGGFACSLEHDVEAVDDRAGALLSPRQERRAALLRHELQHRVGRICRFVGEVQPRRQVI